MRLLLALLFICSLCSCEWSTTTEYVPVKVDFENVNWYAKRAQLAYQSEDKIKQSLTQVIHIETLPKLDIQYFVEQLPNDRQLISVRGTANFTNLREDSEYVKIRNNQIHIYVHKGFDEGASTILNRVLPHLDKNQEILLTGHSLGAAISTLLMIYLHHEGFNIGPSVNFGQPKFTNQHGAEMYDFLPLTRVVNNKDLVPLVPAASLLGNFHGEYRHLGQEVILLGGPHFVYLDNHIVTEKDLSDVWNNLGDLSLKDHMMENYRTNIQDKFTKQVEVAYQDRHAYHKSAQRQ